MIEKIEILQAHSNLDGLYQLNEAHAIELSSLDMERFRHLIELAFVARGVLPDLALLIAFDEKADYNNANFNWFAERHDRFVYVDRIVVSEKLRGQGVAKRLYEELFAEARKAGHTRIVCEVNIDPPNPGSDRFHEQLGFVEIGDATLEGPDGTKGKTVRYLECNLTEKTD